MNTDAEGRIAAQFAKSMAMICVRNSRLEDLHAGQVPVTKTGDGSDVVVVDAEGNRVPWAEVSRIDDDEMRALMRDDCQSALYIPPETRGFRPPRGNRAVDGCGKQMG